MVVEPRLAGIGTADAAFLLTQERAKDLAATIFDGGIDELDRLLAVFDRSGVERRHLCVEPEWFVTPHSFPERNALHGEVSRELSLRSARSAMVGADVSAQDIGAIFYVSSTGFATPSMDTFLQLELGLPGNGVQRDATFGHGCAGGVAALGRAASWCRSNPDRFALVVATELCSLTFQGAQQSATNLVAASLFADGSAAAVLGPGDRGPHLVAEGSHLWPDTEALMGWSQGADGFEVVLSKRVPAFLRRHAAESLQPLCASTGVAPDEISHHALHPGGAAVLRALTEGMELSPDALRFSAEVLARHGNMSSPTALYVLDRHLHCGSMRSGDLGVISAMGPGFAAEHVLFRC